MHGPSTLKVDSFHKYTKRKQYRHRGPTKSGHEKSNYREAKAPYAKARDNRKPHKGIHRDIYFHKFRNCLSHSSTLSQACIVFGVYILHYAHGIR